MKGRIFQYDAKLGEVVEVVAPRAPRKHKAYTRPVGSMSMGVHSSQIPEAMARDRAMGVPTEYNAKGQPLITSQRHQRDLARANGMVNYDGIFS